MKLSLKEELFNSDNMGYDYFLLLELIKEDNNIDLIVLMVEECIDLYLYKEAKKYIKYLKYSLNYTSDRILYLENKIKEIESNTNFIEDTKQKFKIEKISKKDISKSIELCNEYYLKNNNPDYIYFKAKLLYKNNDLEESINQFTLYVNIGYEYIRESYIFLFLISKKISDESQYNKYLNILNNLFSYKDVDVNSNLENILLNYIDNFDDKVCVHISKDILKNKLTQKKKIKSLTFCNNKNPNSIIN